MVLDEYDELNVGSGLLETIVKLFEHVEAVLDACICIIVDHLWIIFDIKLLEFVLEHWNNLKVILPDIG